jgi:hypothetical protein
MPDDQTSTGDEEEIAARSRRQTGLTVQEAAEHRRLMRERAGMHRQQVEARREVAQRHPNLQGYAVLLLDPKQRAFPDFLENNEEVKFKLLIEKMYEEIDENTKIAINNRMLYIAIVERGKGEIYSILVSEYGLDQFSAMRLAYEFNERANAVGSTRATLFRDRSNKSQSASEFLLMHYGERLRIGDLYQNELRKLDSTLMKGLDNEFGGRRDELASLIPTRRVEVNMRLGPDAEQMSVDERRKALNRLLHLGKK